MTDITEDRPRLDRRCREAHPERITIGDVMFVRNDIAAENICESERTLNRRDADGAPYILLGGIKYRPEKLLNEFLLDGIKTNKPQPPKRQRARARA